MSERKTDIVLTLAGEDGNAFFILGRAIRALKRGGREDLVDEFQEEATKGDYDHLLQTCFKYFEVE